MTILSLFWKMCHCGEVTKHEFESNVQSMDTLISLHEDVPRFVISNLLRLLDTECTSEVEDEDSIWVVLNQGGFNIFDIKVLIKQVLVVAGNFITAARSEYFRLVTHEVGEKDGPEHGVCTLVNPSLWLSDVLAHTSLFWELDLRSSNVSCSNVVEVFMDRL